MSEPLLIVVTFLAALGLASVLLMLAGVGFSLWISHAVDEEYDRALADYRAELERASETAITRGLGQEWSQEDSVAFGRYAKRAR